jgi:putative acetyltransferase
MTDEGVIGFLYVHKDFQGRGIASALYKQAERLAKKKGLTRLVTDVSITARAFFEKNGFVVTVEQRKALRGREFLNFRMEKKLPRGEN